jgi:hypothetical protein
MKAKSDFPETLQEAITYFADKEKAFAYITKVRWPDGVIRCPRCGSTKHSFIKTRYLWTCSECKDKKQFTPRIGTILEDSAIPYGKWICAFWMVANCKNGISSYEVGRDLGVTQRTGWFMLQRIRLALQNGTIVKLGGTVEVDESYIGADAKRQNAKQKARRKYKGQGQWNRSAVQGLLERGERSKHGKASRVVLKHVSDVKRITLDKNVRDYVLKGSQIMTDEHPGYSKLGNEFEHKVINHAVAYAQGKVHVNGLENFWSLLKRAIRGTYVNVEPFHLFRYLDEQAFRFNERKDKAGDQGRFIKAIAGIVGKRLTWNKLTGKDDPEGCLPAEGQSPQPC